MHALSKQPVHDMFFRYENMRLVQSVAADGMSGYPLYKMLLANDDLVPAMDVLFWHHAQVGLNLFMS